MLRLYLVFLLGCAPLPRDEQVEVAGLAACQVSGATAAQQEACCESCVETGTELARRLSIWLDAVWDYRLGAAIITTALLLTLSLLILRLLAKTRSLGLGTTLGVPLALGALLNGAVFFPVERWVMDDQLAKVAGADEALRRMWKLGVLRDTNKGYLLCGEQVLRNASDGTCSEKLRSYEGAYTSLPREEGPGRGDALRKDKVADLARFYGEDSTLDESLPETLPRLFSTNPYLESVRAERGGWWTDALPIWPALASFGIGLVVVAVTGRAITAFAQAAHRKRLATQK